MRILLVFVAPVAIAIGACGGNAPKPVEARPPAEASAVVTAAPVADVVITLAGSANALVWDAASSTLFLTDSNTDTLVSWTDAGGLAAAGTFPPAVAGISLGGIVKREDGTLIVTSFGFGKEGTLFQIAPDRTSRALTGLDPVRRRVGLAQDARGALYTAYFVGGGGATPIGGVASVAIDGGAATEIEIAGASTTAGFKKLVGIVATPAALFVADQTQKMIFTIALPDHAVSPLASVPKVDLLVMLPNGDLLTGGGAEITRITQAGRVTTLPTGGYEQVRGLAYDPAGKRLFIVDHSATPGRPDRLHIVPFAG
jgi:hypothetical protein